VRIVTQAEAGQWLKATSEYERIIAKAATLGMRAVGKDAVKKGRESIAHAGFSPRFQRTLRVINKPPSGFVLNPSAYVHSTLNYADIFETGKTITGSPLLWLPLPNVPPYKDRKHMTPAQYVRFVGPLVTMRRPGGLPMLGALVETGGRPTRTRLRRTALRRAAGERTRPKVTIPLFIGVPSITIPKKFDVKGAVEDAFGEFDKFYQENLEIYEGRT
jgi:Family of unknown function (DUF6441)